MKNVSMSTHVCNKNYSGSSTGMEAEIILEGFAKSLSMYGVKYTRFVGDGDSSVYRKLLEYAPYAPNKIQKIECKNHLLRNFSNNLKNEIWECRGNGKPGDPYQRNLVKSKASAFRAAVEGAIAHRAKQLTLTFQARSKELVKDLVNAPSHIFGDHLRCHERDEGYFCKGPKENEVSVIANLEKSGMLAVIQKVIDKLCTHADSLLYSYNSNSVESFNSIVAKLVGGKRINFSLKKGYETRCAGAVTQFNTKQLHTKVHRKLFNSSPCKTVEKLEKQRTSENLKKRKRFKEMSNVPKKKRRAALPNEDYGPNAGFINADIDKIKQEFIDSLKLTTDARKQLEAATKAQASCSLWRLERAKRLTASNFGRICKLKRSTSRPKTAQSLLKVLGELPALVYGRTKERIAILKLEEKLDCKIEKSGFFIDEIQPWLGASPDGLIGEDKLVEIKCPSSAYDHTPEEAVELGLLKFCHFDNHRKIKLKPQHSYMYQVQGQLHICDRKMCFFVIWTPKGMSVEQIYRDRSYWDRMSPKLEEFYKESLLPAIINA